MKRAALSSPAALARSLVQKHGTGNPFELCEELDIFVVDVPLPQGVNGFFANVGEMPIVYLSQGLEEPFRRVVCAHELGHALLHAKSNVFFLTQNTFFSTGRYEREADIFCANLLLCQYEPVQGEGRTVEEIAQETGVPARLVELCFGMDVS